MSVDMLWIYNAQTRGMTFDAAWREAWREGYMRLPQQDREALREGERVPYMEAMRVEVERQWNFALASAKRNARDLIAARHAGMSEEAVVRRVFPGGSYEFAYQVAMRCVLTARNGSLRV